MPDLAPDDTYRTLAAPSQGLYKEKGSKFIAYAYPVQSLDEIRSHLDRLHKEHFDARHHCYAYILGPHQKSWRANDDGEPSGTGGRPIHGQLLSAQLTDTLVVVVRYFGGILLGASGLAAAYKAAAHDALAQATIDVRTINDQFAIDFPYEAMNDVMRLLKEYNLKPTNSQYDLRCNLTVAVRQSQSQRLAEALGKLPGIVVTPTVAAR